MHKAFGINSWMFGLMWVVREKFGLLSSGVWNSGITITKSGFRLLLNLKVRKLA
jgi:predicted small integral membrane protein